MKEFIVRWTTFFVVCLLIMLLWNKVFVDVCNGYIREIDYSEAVCLKFMLTFLSTNLGVTYKIIFSEKL